MTQDIAFFGGSFNPPHRGHRQVLELLDSLPQFDAVWMVPSYHHPFDKKLASYEDRMRLCEIAAQGLGKVIVSDIEKKMGEVTSYTIDVIRWAKKNQMGDRFWIVVGEDCRKEIEQWKNYRALRVEASFFFLPRGKDAPFMDVSSSGIRDALAQKKDCSRFLLPEVEAYALKNNLY